MLVVGPFDTGGGLAHMARRSIEGFDPNRFDIATCETAKDTPEGRSLYAACRSHWRRWRRLAAGIRGHKPHVVHIHTCSYNTFYRTLLDVWTCRFFRRPYVLHIHGGLFAEFLAALNGVRRSLVIEALRRAQRVIVLSESWRTKLTQQVAGLKINVISNAIDEVPATETPAAGAPRGGGVLFVGDLSEPKRPEDLLVSYAALPSAMRERFSLTIVGGGEASRLKRLIALADRLDVSTAVRFAGALPHEQIRSLMQRADLLAVTSRAEGMPLVLLEAMQAGAAIVSTRVGAIPEMVCDGTEASLVEPRDTDGLARAMKRLLGDDAMRERLAFAARARVDRDYSTMRFRGALAELWSDVAASAPTVGRLPSPRLASSSFRSVL